MSPHKPGLIVGYIRVSTDRQAKEGQSLRAQEQRIRAFAKAHGLKVDRIYREDGASGKDTDRPALKELRSDLDKIGIVIVYKFDRISRSVVDLYELLEEFKVAGVAFNSVSEGVDTSSAVGEFIIGVLAALAQMERKLIGERTRDTLASKKANGEHIGRVPFGYRIAASGKLEKDPDQQKTIARIKRLHRAGHSIRVISGRENMPKSTVHAVIKDHRKSRNAKYAA